MQFLVISKMQVQQVPTDQYPSRNLLLEFTFFNKYDINSTWEDLTQTMSITLPKNVVVKGWNTTTPFVKTDEASYTRVQLGNTRGQNSNLGGGFTVDGTLTDDITPTFLRGDMVRFNAGYRSQLVSGEVTYWTGEKGIPDLFAGFISGVSPKLPFTLQCEDSMWLCKQIPTKSKQYPNESLQNIVTEILRDAAELPIIKKYGDFAKLTVSDFSKTDLKFNVRNFTTTRGSLASLLSRVKTEYRVDSYFRGKELRIGYLHYVPDDNVDHVFTFQKNILDNDKLKWQRKDDRVLSMIVKSNYLKVKDSGSLTLDGHEKTTHASTEILIYNQGGQFLSITKEKGKEFPTKYLNDIGERFTFNIYDAITDPKKLLEIGKPQLEKYYYDGFKGSFTTFGIPYVKHGDTVRLVNPALPEQDGAYKVRAVRYYGGVDEGLRQEIFLDYLIKA